MPKRRRTRRRLRGGASDFEIMVDYKRAPLGAHMYDNPAGRRWHEQGKASTAAVKNWQPGFWDKAMNTLAKPAEWTARRIFGDETINNIKGAAERGDVAGMVKGSVKGAIDKTKSLMAPAGKGRRRRIKRTIRRRR